MQHDQRTDELIYRHLAAGASPRDIARELMSFFAVRGDPQFVSLHAVIGRAKRRGWFPVPDNGLPPFTPAERKYVQHGKTKKKTPMAKPYTPPAARSKAPAVQSFGSQHAIMCRDLTPPESASPAACAVIGLKPNQCRWPIGDINSQDFRFCGKRRVAGKPYCSEHMKKQRGPGTTAERSASVLPKR